jgi:hypothetical protein
MKIQLVAILGLLIAAPLGGCSDNGKGGTKDGGGTSDGGDDLSVTGDCTLTDTCTVDPDSGVGESCGLNSCAKQGAECGLVGDGCGHILNCGTCPSNQACGGGGTPFKCGGNVSPCMPTDCATAGASCGPIGDGCGGLIMSCGSCSGTDVCGNGPKPSTCGPPGSSSVDAGAPPPCGRFCGMFGSCSGTKTSISGTVVTGTIPTMTYGPDPVYNATVYIPTDTVAAFPSTLSCDRCGADITGTPMVKQTTGVDGKFKLDNVPCGTGINLPIVIQLGRFRTQIVVTDVQCCMDNPLQTTVTHLPRKHDSMNDIPRIAVSTGNVDSLECVLRKMGIDDTEFTVPSGTGRIHLYKGNGVSAATGTTPAESTLVSGTNPTISTNYDMVLFPCWGGQHNKDLNSQKTVIDFADRGGRVFATHFSYTWLATVGTVSTPHSGVPMGMPPQPQPWVGTANWNVNENDYGTNQYTGLIDMSATFDRGKALAKWLLLVGASTTLGQIPISVLRQDLDGVVAPSQRWLYTTTPNDPAVHFTFNTPVGQPADKQCGRVVFSDFHVENAMGNGSKMFPQECGTQSALTPQERLLEFMLFDLAACIAPDNPTGPGCTAQTCQSLAVECGPQGDGCGNIIQCGTCPPPQTCGGGGVRGKCGAPPCTSTITCTSAGANCGAIGDGCGGTIDCGVCTPPQSCGGAGVANVCGGSIIP